MSVPRPPLSERDWAQLSAYLDGKLNARQRAALERRLAAEPHLRQALTELHETVALLRALPTLPAPRNFTLDPTLYGRAPRRWRVAAALQLSGALGTALAVVLIVLGVLFPAQQSARPQNAPPAENVAWLPTASSTPTVAATPQALPTFAPPATAAPEEEALGGMAAPADEAAPPSQAFFAAPLGEAAEAEGAIPPALEGAPQPEAPTLREPQAPPPTLTPSPSPSATATPTPTPSATPTPTKAREKIAAPAPTTASRPRWWLVGAGSVILLVSLGLWRWGKRRA